MLFILDKLGSPTNLLLGIASPRVKNSWVRAFYGQSDSSSAITVLTLHDRNLQTKKVTNTLQLKNLHFNRNAVDVLLQLESS